MKIRLTKIRESDNPEVPNNIDSGYTVVGYPVKYNSDIGEERRNPVIGEPYVVIQSIPRWFRTSPVVRIIDDNTFETLNSIYRIDDI